jgi:protein involved in polysaccharide export with SLBB domain
MNTTPKKPKKAIQSSYPARSARSVLLLIVVGTCLYAPMSPFISTSKAGTDGNNYQLMPNDMVDFQVAGEPDLTVRTRIDGKGNIILPLVGAVNVGGKNVSDATQIITSRLKDGYLGCPQVTLTITNYGRRFFTVLGQVTRPGAYDLQGLSHISLLEAIGTAGGYTKTANSSSISIKKKDGKTIIVNATKLAKGATGTTGDTVEPGDIIIVPEALF